MGPGKERPVDWREFEGILRKLGFELKRQDGTAHRHWEHPCFRGQRRLVTVSQHHSPYARSLLKSMLKQAGLGKKEFMRCLEDKHFAKRLAQKHAAQIMHAGSNQ